MIAVFQDFERRALWEKSAMGVLPRIGERVVHDDVVYQVHMVTHDPQNHHIYFTVERV